MTSIHNLDNETNEYFKFILGGVTYLFRYPTTLEAEEASKLSDISISEAGNWIAKFISRLDGTAVDFSEIYKNMNINTARAFNKMIIAEINEDNQS